MTYLDILDLLKENYCEGGKTDKDGIWRYISSGNTVALVNNNGGWVYRCKDISREQPMLIK